MKTTETEHTPGPWYHRPEEPCVEAQLDSGCNILVAMCDGGGYVTPAAAQANARLIAAAPDLLNCLSRLVDDLTESHEDELNSDHSGDGPDCSYCRNIDRARAAIAKAGGGL